MAIYRSKLFSRASKSHNIELNKDWNDEEASISVGSKLTLKAFGQARTNDVYFFAAKYKKMRQGYKTRVIFK